MIKRGEVLESVCKKIGLTRKRPRNAYLTRQEVIYLNAWVDKMSRLGDKK